MEAGKYNEGIHHSVQAEGTRLMDTGSNRVLKRLAETLDYLMCITLYEK